MKKVEFNLEKNELLRNTRGTCFDDVVLALENGNIIDIVQHASRPNQKILVMEINDYVYEVPFVEDEKKYFLKTLYPSRKFKKRYN